MIKYVILLGLVTLSACNNKKTSAAVYICSLPIGVLEISNIDPRFKEESDGFYFTQEPNTFHVPYSMCVRVTQ